MDQILRILSQSLPDFSPQLAKAARAILDNPGGVAVNSMRGVAAEAKVSPPTMLRLAQRLGFERYEDFRAIFKQRLVSSRYSERAKDLRQAAKLDGVAGVINRTVAAATQSIRQFDDASFAQDIEGIAERMLAARKVYVVGVSAMFGVVSSFQYVCRMVLPNMQVASVGGSTPIDGLVTLMPDDLVFGVSLAPYGRGAVLALQYAKNKGAYVAAITDRRTSPLAQIADITAIVDTLSPHYFPTLISATAALEALSAAITIKGGADAVKAIAEYDTAMRSNNFYWDEE